MTRADARTDVETVKSRLTGVITPVTTPFEDEGRVNHARLRKNIEALLAAGVQGVLVAGSTGEAPLLTMREFAELIAAAREVMPRDKILLVGAGMESTQATMDACRIAGELLADAVLVRPPSYYAPMLDDVALRDHFWAVADDSPIPVLVYNMPKYTGININYELISELGGHRNIVGVKDSSGSEANLKEYLNAVPELSMLAGSGSILLPALSLGAVGGILAVSCFAAELAVSVWRGFVEGADSAEVEARQEVLAHLNGKIVNALGIAGIKAAMDQTGSFGGRVRAPLRDLDPSERRDVQELVRAHLN